MDIFNTILTIFLAIYFIIAFVFSLFEKKPIKTLFMFAAIGVVALILVNLTSPFTKISLPINMYTIISSAAFSIPGVITLLILKIIFI